MDTVSLSGQHHAVAVKEKCMEKDLILYIGTYGTPLKMGDGTIYRGKGKGIYTCYMDSQSGEIIAGPVNEETSNTSWIERSQDGKFLYAVNELDEFEGKEQGAVSSFSVCGGGKPALIGSLATGGKAPCHLCLNKEGTFLAAANYSSGSISLFNLKDGKIIGQTHGIFHTGKGADPLRQECSHLHSVLLDRKEKHLLAVNLGDDTITVYRKEEKDGIVSEQPDFVYHGFPGSGLRSMVFTSDCRFLYVTGELDVSVYALKYDENTGSLEYLQKAEAYEGERQDFYDAAGAVISPDDRYLYVSTRGSNKIAVYSIEQATGYLTPVQFIDTDGKNPRSLALDPAGRWVIAGNQDSDSLTVYKRDMENGQLSLWNRFLVPTPVCVKIYNNPSGISD